MAAELRWVLLGLSLPLLAGIWWWTARRTRQAPGNAELRESTPPLDPRHSDLGSDADGESEGESDGEEMRAAPEPRDWGVPPFEPLSIRTANFDGVPTLDGPMMVGAEPARAPSSAPAPPSATAQPSASVIAAASSSVPPAARPAFLTGSTVENSDRLAAVAPHAPNTAEMQRIVTVRVCAVGETRWPGVDLLAALELHGLAFGRYQVFHRKHVDGRSLFCVASLVEPGTFDVAEMPVQEFRGVTLFAVLPGPIVPLETVDELLRTARGLAEELSGTVQDAKGMPLSPQRAAAVREDVARFQASLSGN